MSNNIDLKMDDASIKDLIKNLQATGKLAWLGGINGVQYSGDLIYSRARASCPVFTGYLLSSQYKEIDPGETEIKMNIGYGGKYNKLNIYTGDFTDSYAVDVHEGHKISETSRKYGATRKWLEKAFNSAEETYLPILQAYITGAIFGSWGYIEPQIRSIFQGVAQRAAAHRGYKTNRAKKSSSSKKFRWRGR